MAGVFRMVNEELSNITTQIDELSHEPPKNTEKEDHTIKKDVVLFFSFDIVNSTSYKTINYFGWAQALNLLFKELRTQVHKDIEGSELWRVLGDEAIFIIKIRAEQELVEYINKIYEIMITTIYKLKKGEFFALEDIKLMKLQNILSLKLTAWIAVVNDIGDISDKKILQEDTDNIFEHYKPQEGHEVFEFLGNDIDAGFRIATQTQEGRMVLSYELAYLLGQQAECLSHLHIITYKKLKGIWKDKLYPIIWYHNPKAYIKPYKKEIRLDENITFDSYSESDLIKEYYDNRNPQKQDNKIYDTRMYLDTYYALKKILLDRNLNEKIEHLRDVIKTKGSTHTKYFNAELLQLHCVAICFLQEKGVTKILVAKRQEARNKLGGKWEFGCAKANIDKSIEQKIKEEYAQDFNIKIEPILDEKRSMKEPLPIALYSVSHSPRSEKKDKGIITLARIIGDYNPNTFHATNKHSEVRWINETDLDNIEVNFANAVPDFKQTLIAAFDKIKSLCKEDNETITNR